MAKKLDKFHRHEALDRTHVILCMLDDHLITHPYIEKKKKLKKKVEKARNKLAAIYLEIGKKI